MKKGATIFLVFICIIVGGLISKTFIKSTPISAAVFLPENVLIYVDQKDFAAHYNRFLKSALGKTINSINFVELTLDFGVPLNVVNSLREFQNLVLSEESEKFFEEFLSNDCSFALLHESAVDNYWEYFQKNSVLITEPVHRSRTFDLMIERARTKLNISSSQYGNHVIYRFPKSEDFKVFFASVEGKTLFTLDERVLRQLLDRYDTKGSNLTENYFFADFQKKNNGITLFSYFELTPLAIHFDKLLNEHLFSHETFDLMSITKGFTTAILSSSITDGSVKNTITLHYNTHLLDKDILYFFKFPPEKDTNINTSPQDTLLYFWMNTFDIRRLWELFAKKTKVNKTQLESIEDNIALTAGIPFESLLDLFGHRVHYILRKPSQADPVPLPNFTIIFELTNPSKAQETLQQLVLLNQIPHGNDIYRDIPFTYWGNEMQAGLQPVYSIHDKYLYISSSVDMQLDVVTAMLDGNGLTSLYPFTSYGSPLLMDNNSSVYVKVTDFVDFMKDFIDLGEAMFVRQNRALKYKTQTFVYKILYPLFESMKMYSSITFTSVFKNGKIEVEMYLNPEDI